MVDYHVNHHINHNGRGSFYPSSSNYPSTCCTFGYDCASVRQLRDYFNNIIWSFVVLSLHYNEKIWNAEAYWLWSNTGRNVLHLYLFKTILHEQRCWVLAFDGTWSNERDSQWCFLKFAWRIGHHWHERYRSVGELSLSWCLLMIRYLSKGFKGSYRFFRQVIGAK